ncbi:STM4014 family protein [Viridibacterium curvum]|uniref:ATP-grasp domain-containing protein n=1 Tax=Viridibacterium curvum TaxID=1101404 RepID=A0ABP9QRR8_9RHOO
MLQCAADSVAREAVSPGTQVVLGVATGKRLRLLQAARAGFGLPPAQVVEWSAWLDAPEILLGYLERPCVFKIESPGDDPVAQHKLCVLGCRLLGRDVPSLPAHGELRDTDAWFAGFSAALGTLAALLAQHPHLQMVNAPAEVLLMTDKLACQQHLVRHAVSTPRLLGPVINYDDLQSRLDQNQLDRVFIKARYGSSAAGVVAYRRASGGREQATTTARIERTSSGLRLFNLKRMSRYSTRHDIADLINALAGQQAYVEAWLPKPRHGDASYDFRVVTLAGRVAHRVARVGQHIMTNLHLGNRRGDAASLLNAPDLAALEAVSMHAAASFPQSLVAGFDVVVKGGKASILEANAFGDLLPGLQWQGQDTYAAQLQALAA